MLKTHYITLIAPLTEQKYIAFYQRNDYKQVLFLLLELKFVLQNFLIIGSIASVLTSGYSPSSSNLVMHHQKPVSSFKVNQVNNDFQDIYLVAGSSRSQQGGSEVELKFWGGFNETDYQHLTSFGGCATTMDLNPSHISGAKCIVGDVCTYDFLKNGYNIQHVLFERLPTVDINSEKLPTNSYIATCVENVSKAMKKGAILEIEIDPYTLLHDMNEKDQELKSWLKTADPFTGIFSREYIKNTYKAISYRVAPVSFLKKEKLSDEEKNQMLYCSNNIKNIIALHVGNSTNLSTNSFLNEINHQYLYLYSKKFTEDVRGKCFSDTTLRYFLASMVIQNNKYEIIRIIEDLDFRNVTLDLRENEHNKRKKCGCFMLPRHLEKTK